MVDWVATIEWNRKRSCSTFRIPRLRSSRRCRAIGRQNGKLFRAWSLVVRVASHPLRPGLGANAAGFRPGTSCIKLAMPLECPQFLDAYLPDREIQETDIDGPLVTGKAETLYFRPTRTPIGYVHKVIRRRIGLQGLAVNRGILNVEQLRFRFHSIVATKSTIHLDPKFGNLFRARS